MALTQSARLPGPSWDEEVVPALRKRLETESRTLARRISAISMSSNIEDSIVNLGPTFPEPKPKPKLQIGYEQQRPSSSPRPRHDHQQQPQPPLPNQLTIPSLSTRVNGVQSTRKPVATSFHRARTYSQPYATDGTRPQQAKTNAGTTSRSPRPTDVKPTRIPKASRVPSVTSQASSPPMSLLNGSAHGHGPPTTITPTQTPYPKPSNDFHLYTFPSSNSNINVSTQPSRIINESPPFSTTESLASYSELSVHDDLGPRPRQSTDSEERPFEHWYRGEVSRNGGVGELRVGRRQEMLEIANYGHAINNKRKAVASRKAALLALEDSRRHRKRADSIAGIGTRERERGSLYLDDDERADQIGRVLDEDPLTDLDGSDTVSIINHYRYSNHNTDPDTNPGASDIIDTSPSPPPQDSFVPRSVTPTQYMQRRPKSRNGSSSSRLPMPTERKSSDSRLSTPTQHSTRSHPDLTMSVAAPSIKPPSPPVALLSSSTNSRQTQSSMSSTPSSAKRGVSPGATGSSGKRPRTGTKTTKSKGLTVKKLEDDKRGSVAHYPTPGEGVDVLYAIPSWTQPKAEGNWDDVVLPVVARKKGLDDQYEKADGSPQPRKQDQMPVAPAPGTFGFNESKYRPSRSDSEDIQMDDFGLPNTAPPEPEKPGPSRPDLAPETDNLSMEAVSVAHDNIRIPVKPPPSPAPFSHYLEESPPLVRHVVRTEIGRDHKRMMKEQDDEGAGCCKCVIM